MYRILVSKKRSNKTIEAINNLAFRSVISNKTIEAKIARETMLSRAKRRQTLGSLTTNHGTPGKPSAAKRPSRKSMGSRRSMAGLGTTPSHRRKSRGPRISQYGTAAGRSRHSSTAAGFQQSGTEGVAAIATPSGGLLSGTAASRARKKAPSKKDGKTMRSSSRAAQFARSSVRTMAASQAKDKRRTQIASKVYQKESKRLIIQFLAKNNYPGEISPKTFLKHNSQREFFAIIELFFKKIDHSMHFGCSPDVVITTLKNLGYQDAISKSDLQAIGTQHTMPRILAVLRWLVQLLEYDHVIEIGKDAMERSGFGEEEQDEIVAEDEDDREVKRFLRMTSLSYMSYMQGDDEAHEEQEVQMVEYYENAEREANEELAQRREANELLRLELAELESGTSSLEVLEKRAANLDSDERDLIQYARELDGRTERKQGDCERKQVALDLQAAAFDVARATASELTHRVSQQALSAGDIKRLRATRTELRTTLALLQEQCEDLTRIQYEDDRTLKSSIQAFEAHIRDYNNDAAELELLGLADLDSTSTDPLMRCMQEARVPTELSGEQGLWAALERSRRTQSAQSAERPPFNVDFRGTARLALRKFISDAKQRSKAFQKSIAGLPHDEVRCSLFTRTRTRADARTPSVFAEPSAPVAHQRSS